MYTSRLELPEQGIAGASNRMAQDAYMEERRGHEREGSFQEKSASMWDDVGAGGVEEVEAGRRKP